MPSPFPGMDPWLEAPGVFPDFHNRFIAVLSAMLNVQLPPPYFAAIGTRVVVEGEKDRHVEPDVDVLRPAGANGTHAAAGGGIATLAATEVEPVVVHAPREESTEWLLEVRTGEGDDELVTSVELLSRSNKQPGDGREKYLQKQREMIERRVNLVEIDFLRTGLHTTAVPLTPARKTTGGYDYHVCISTPEKPDDYAVYPIRLPQRLPGVRLPLRAGEPGLLLALQPAFDRSYEESNFARRVRYARPVDPPLTAEQQAWADELLRTAGRTP